MAERDAAWAKADRHERDWIAAKYEFGCKVKEIAARAEAAEQRVKELECQVGCKDADQYLSERVGRIATLEAALRQARSELDQARPYAIDRALAAIDAALGDPPEGE